MRRHLIGMALASPLALTLAWSLVPSGRAGAADEPRATVEPNAGSARAGERRGEAVWTTAVAPKPLTSSVDRALKWLADHQLESGGWGQGEESPNMRGASDATLRERANVADTCVAAVALIRSGSTPRQGPYKDAVSRAVRFVAGQVEESDSQSITVTTVHGTRVQQKLGPNIDTFLASMLLAEAKGRMPDARDDRRVDLALDKVLEKIKRHQKDDGSFEGQGWAPILAQSLCGKGINRARQAGAQVAPTVLARAEDGAKRSFALSAPATTPSAGAAKAAAPTGGPVGGFAGSRLSGRGAIGAGFKGDAGVELYSRAASLGVLQDSVNTNQTLVSKARDDARNAKDPQVRDRARKELDRFAEAEKVNQEAKQAVIGRLSDRQFVSGFGSNGGEEFLSYMNIAESLVVKGGSEWKTWDESMTANLGRVQNEDGSWTGHHCITGRTFCTGSALLVLLADRTPVPVPAKK